MIQSLKSLIFLFLICFFFNSFSQVNQTDVIAKWSEGEYSVYQQEYFTKMDNKCMLSFVRNAESQITSIKIDKKEYKNDFKYTSFVRYYYRSDDYDPEYSEALYFTPKSIVVFKVLRILNEYKIDIKGCYGKKADEKHIKDEILNHLKNTFKEVVFSGLRYYEMIKSVKLVPITIDSVPLEPGVPFKVGVITTFYNGQSIKTKNIGGTFDHDIDDWIISYKTGVKVVGVKGKGYYVSDCATLKGKGMNFELIPSDKFQGSFSRYRSWEYDTIILNCANDNSLIAKRARRFANYDEIAFSCLNKEGVKENKKLEKDKDKGYLPYANDIEKMFRTIEPKYRLIRVKKDNKFGYADTSGNIIIPIEYENGYSGYFNDKLIGVIKNGLTGFINDKNQVIIPIEFEKGLGFSNGRAPILKNGKWGFIDVTGKFVINPTYDKVYPFNDAGVAIALVGEKCGLISKTGAVVLPIEYDEVFNMNSNDYLMVKKGGLYGIVNNSGKIVLPIEYKDIFNVKGYYAIIQNTDDHYGYFESLTGNLLKECKYSSAGDFEYDKANVSFWIGNKKYNGKLYTSGKEEWDEPLPSGSNSSGSGYAGTKSSKNAGNSTDKTCFILNDLTPAQMGGKNSIKLGFVSYRLATNYIARGKTMEVDCDDVIVYKLKNENSTEYNKENDLFKTKGQCGQTIKLSDYWK